MKEIILAETGVSATVIPEPYESEERKPSIGETLFWFGHQSNLPDLQRAMRGIDRGVIVMSNHPSCIPWSKPMFDRMMQKELIVIVPTGKSMAKSENRMVESIRNGKYVCAEYLPSYEPFYHFFPCTNLGTHIEQAIADHPIDQIQAAQEYIRDRYSPATVANQWLEVINEHI